jgi:putative pyruvate formate lyase activating enzyme
VAEPSYLSLWSSGELARRAAAAARRLAACDLCPRRCGADRASGRAGECGLAAQALVASYGPHFGEEDCLVGRTGALVAGRRPVGSGTIFFAGCNLKCVFCQNWEISHRRAGIAVDATELAGMMLELQARDCLNINLVTPSHVVPQILAALVQASEEGLRLPLVYNTSGYDALPTLRLLDGVVDIYLPDFKFWSPEASEEYLTARDYPETARTAIAEMHRQTGDLQLDSDGVAVRGLLVRHLVMPHALDESTAIFAWLAALSQRTFVNVMAQYRPAGRAAHYMELARPLERAEWTAALERARAAGLERAGAW